MKMETESSHRKARSRPGIPAWSSAAGTLAPLLFATVAVLLTSANLSYLRSYGWTFWNHHGVPWTSGLALGQHGWVMVVTFAVCGVLVVVFGLGLHDALPANRSGRLAAKAVIAVGVALALAAFPVNRPSDPSDVLSWTVTWHGRIHLAGFVLFLLSSVAAPLATAMSTRHSCAWSGYSKLSAFAATVLAVTAILPSSWAWAWYLFLATILGWLAAVSLRLRRLAYRPRPQ